MCIHDDCPKEGLHEVQWATSKIRNRYKVFFHSRLPIFLCVPTYTVLERPRKIWRMPEVAWFVQNRLKTVQISATPTELILARYDVNCACMTGSVEISVRKCLARSHSTFFSSYCRSSCSAPS